MLLADALNAEVEICLPKYHYGMVRQANQIRRIFRCCIKSTVGKGYHDG